MTRSRIAYIVNAFPKLSETFIAGEVAEVVRRKAEVLICSINAPCEQTQHDIIAQSNLLAKTVYGEERFLDALTDFDPQLIHAHFATNPTKIALTLSRKLDIPFTFTAHGYDVYRKPPTDFHERAVAASAVVTVSESNARYICESFNVSRNQIHVIPCGVDISRFCPSPNGSQTPIIVCVARFSPVKNHELLLEACSQLRDRSVDFECMLIGDGRCRSDIERQVRQRALESHVFMKGALGQHNVVKWWQRAAVGVLPSHSEGMPVSLMEAAACGVPVVATDVGGVSELVVDGQTGFVVRAGHAKSLADALEVLLGDVSIRRRMGRRARRRAEAEFSVEKQVDRLSSVWAAVENTRVLI